MTSDSQSSPSIVIIGAGISGLMAARTLLNSLHGEVNVTVLEASIRPGGRVHTIQSSTQPSIPIELGATWVHGACKENPLVKLAQSLSLRIKHDFEDDNELCIKDGTPMVGESEGEAPSEIKRLHRSFVDWMRGKLYGGGFDTASIRDLFELYVEIKKLEAMQRLLLRSALNTWIEQDQAASIDDLSARFHNQDEEFGGSDAMFPQGYSQLIHTLRTAHKLWQPLRRDQRDLRKEGERNRPSLRRRRGH